MKKSYTYYIFKNLTFVKKPKDGIFKTLKEYALAKKMTIQAFEIADFTGQDFLAVGLQWRFHQIKALDPLKKTINMFSPINEEPFKGDVEYFMGNFIDNYSKSGYPTC